MAHEDTSSSQSKPWTFRIENIPDNTSARALLNHFVEEDRPGIEIRSICPAVDAQSGSLTATISFTVPDGGKPREPRLIDPDESDLDIDDTFYGLTPLNDPQQPIAADVIAVTGLAGHAFGSWASSSRHMWLRDALPKDLPNVRVLIYGYNSQLQKATSRSIVGDHVRMFKQRLLTLPTSARVRHRPIIFIGHSLGSLLIKKALVEIVGSPTATHICDFPFVVFLGAPHRGLDNSALQTILGVEDLSKDIVDELGESSPTLTDLNESFAKIAHQLDIMSCYELRPTPTLVKDVDGIWKREGPPAMMVTQNSAMLHSAKEIRVPCNADHSKIAKLKRGEAGLYPTIKGHIQQALERFEVEQALLAERRSLYGDGPLAPSPRQLPLQERSEHMIAAGSRLLLPAPHDIISSPSLQSEVGYTPPSSFGSPPNFARPLVHLHPGPSRDDPQDDQTQLIIGSSGSDVPNQHRVTPNQILQPAISPFISPMIPPIEARHNTLGDYGNIPAEKEVVRYSASYQAPEVNADFGPTVETPVEESQRQPSTITKRMIDPTEKEVYLAPGEASVRQSPSPDQDHRMSSPDEILSRKGSKSPQFHEIEKSSGQQGKRRSSHGKFFQMLHRKSSNDTSSVQAFLQAAAEDNIDVIRELVTHGMDLESKTSQQGNRTALHEAARTNAYETATFLIGKGAKVDAKTKNKCTPLHEAAFHGSKDVARLLILERAQLEAQNLEDETPLQLAVKRGHVEIVRSLVEKGANVNGIRIDRKNTLQIAQLRGILEVCDILRAAGARLPRVRDDAPQWPGLI